MIAEGRFREDLYQRLNVFRIQLPALRERPEDVELQARHFLAHYQDGSEHPGEPTSGRASWKCCGRCPGRATPASWRTSSAKPWPTGKAPGRCSKSATCRAGCSRRSPSRPCRPSRPRTASLDHLVEEACSARLSLTQAVEEYERRLLARVLAETGGNRTHAAHRLGLTPRTIFAKVKKYQLD